MNKKIKLLILIIMSLSVYFIYNATKNNTLKVVALGDGLTEGINSYGIKDYSYCDYLKIKLKDYRIKTNLEKYSSKDMSLSKMLFIMQNTPKIKKDLREADVLTINLGYNDLLYKLITTEELNDYKLTRIISQINRDYQLLIKEIKRYYHNKIIVIGYFRPGNQDYYQNKGIVMLNKVLSSNSEIVYLETLELLKDRDKYFSNPRSYYPNNYGYMKISNKILKKLEK